VRREDRTVAEFLLTVEPPKRRQDAELLIDVMEDVTGEPAQLWSGSIIGFGRYEYPLKSGGQGEAPGASFSPRKTATSIYFSDGVAAYEDELRSLGPHTPAVWCVYVKDLSLTDLDVLRSIVAKSYATLMALEA
jgi:hypothetical protein